MKLLNPVTGQIFTARIWQRKGKYTVRKKLLAAIWAEGLVRYGKSIKHTAAEKEILTRVKAASPVSDASNKVIIQTDEAEIVAAFSGMLAR